MTTAWQRMSETPVTAVVVIAYVTAQVLALQPDEGAAALLAGGIMVPMLVADGEPWRLVTHAFLHAGFLHLGLNLLALVWLGPALERSLGSLRFAVLYALAAVCGGLAVTLVDEPQQPVVGGSGALFGMMGAAVAIHMLQGRHLLEFLDYQGPSRLLGLIAVNLVLGFLMPSVSNAAHVGGLLGGFLLTFGAFAVGRERPRLATRVALAVAFSGLLAQALWPVARWDHALLCHAAAPPGPRKDELRRAASLLLTGDADAIATDAELEPLVEDLRQLLARMRRP
jgi:membrane associated rhomboid family serine protease